MPTTPQRLVQRHARLHPRQSQLHVHVLGGEEGALGFQHGEQVFGTGLVAALGDVEGGLGLVQFFACLLYTSPSPRDATLSRMPSSA